ncbi:MAG: HEAT repeat domain-containing protein, partial [Isosphaeraceae bacterium]
DLSRSPDPMIRRTMLQGIRQGLQMGLIRSNSSRIRALVPLVYAAARDVDQQVRTGAAEVLLYLNDDSPRGLEALGGLIRDPNVDVRLATLRRIQQYSRLPRGLHGSLLGLLAEQDSRIRTAAIGAIPPPALAEFEVIDRLLIALKHPDSSLREAAAAKLMQARRPNGIRQLPDGGMMYHFTTSRALLRHPDALEILISAIDDPRPSMRHAAAWLLPAFTAQADRWVPLLVRGLTDSDPTVRMYAARAVGQIDPPPRSAIRPLLALALNSDRFNNMSLQASLAAAQALDAIGGEARSKLMRAMLGRLGSLDENERQCAHQTLFNIGVPAQKELLRAFVSPATSHKLASEILSHVYQCAMRDRALLTGSQGAEALAVIRSLAHDTDFGVQMLALWSLIFIEPSDPEPAELYLDFLHGEPDQKRQQRQNQWTGLLQNAVAIPILVRGLEDEDGRVRIEVAQSLERIAFVLHSAESSRQNPFADNAKVFPIAADAKARKAREEQDRARAVAARALLLHLKDPDVRMRWIAAQTLGCLRAEAAKAIPSLVQMARTEDGRVSDDNLFVPRNSAYVLGANANGNEALRIAAIRGLGLFGREAARAVPDLISFLDDADPRVCWYAAEALGNLGTEARQAIPHLVKLLRSQAVAAGAGANGGVLKVELPLRLVAADALGRIGPEARAAIPGLTALLADPDSRVRGVAVAALGLMGPEARVAAPELVRLAAHGTVLQVARSAAWTLVKIGPAAHPAIERAFHDPDPATRERAVEMIASLGVLPIVPLVARCLDDPVADVRRAAASALLPAASRPEILAAVPRLVVALGDDDDEVRDAAASILSSASGILLFPIATIAGYEPQSNMASDDGFEPEVRTIGH